MEFLDVRKAYPTCRRAAMLERLYAKLAAAPGGSENHRPKLFSAVATMLRTENCRSKVVVDGAESAEYTVGHGLREGAVLSVPRVSSGRAEIEDEVPNGLPRPPEFEQPNAACS